ncbi:MAG: SHOCT domain-containing protein [Lachnospiraceae bacterium]|nr:SHOCT domain-containing protein [Lachnospiraceae bacterium]
MRRRVRVKPGKTQSMMGMVVGVIFCLIGLFIAIPIFGLFGVFWTAVAVAITVTNGINAFSEKGVPTHEIYVDEYEDGYEMEDQSVKERLETAKKLYEEGIITKEEYEEKRRQLINEI